MSASAGRGTTIASLRSMALFELVAAMVHWTLSFFELKRWERSEGEGIGSAMTPDARRPRLADLHRHRRLTELTVAAHRAPSSTNWIRSDRARLQSFDLAFDMATPTGAGTSP